MLRTVRIGLVLTLAVTACADEPGTESAASTTGASSSTTSMASRTVAFEGYSSDVYGQTRNWVCSGITPDDPCDSNLDATIIDADGTTTIERFEPVEDSEVDCFYVYPTISRDPGTLSDRTAGANEEIFVTRQQAARFGARCRVFAPIYRQVTLEGLTARLGGDSSGDDDIFARPYEDVLDAFKHYMANENGGRGVVLVGHSQGAGLLAQLIRSEIDPSDDLRQRLVSAILLGAAVTTGGSDGSPADFAHIPPCSSPSDTACVISYASFRIDVPPPANSLFGRPRSGTGRAVCTNPAQLSGGNAPLTPYFATDGQSIAIGGLGSENRQWLPGASITTPFVALPGLVESECVEAGEFDYLALTIVSDPNDPRIDDIGGDLTPEWGMHLVDANVAMGNLVSIVSSQVESFR